MIDYLAEAISDRLFLSAIQRHRSRSGWRQAPAYSRYLKRCRREARRGGPWPEPVVAAAEALRVDGIASLWTSESGALAAAMADRLAAQEAMMGPEIWTTTEAYPNYLTYRNELYVAFPEIEGLLHGPLGALLEAYYGTAFKIFFASLYRNTGTEAQRVGSQRWHSDSGPGICVNVMFYLEPTADADGPLEALPWRIALSVYGRERSTLRRHNGEAFRMATGSERREMICDYYDKAIEDGLMEQVVRPTGPAGLIVPFLNNTLHRGGWPRPGSRRTAVVFHAYPSHIATDFAAMAFRGIAKSAPYPRDGVLMAVSKQKPSYLRRVGHVRLQPAKPWRPAGPLLRENRVDVAIQSGAVILRAPLLEAETLSSPNIHPSHLLQCRSNCCPEWSGRRGEPVVATAGPNDARINTSPVICAAAYRPTAGGYVVSRAGFRVPFLDITLHWGVSLLHCYSSHRPGALPQPRIRQDRGPSQVSGGGVLMRTQCPATTSVPRSP